MLTHPNIDNNNRNQPKIRFPPPGDSARAKYMGGPAPLSGEGDNSVFTFRAAKKK